MTWLRVLPKTAYLARLPRFMVVLRDCIAHWMLENHFDSYLGISCQCILHKIPLWLFHSQSDKMYWCTVCFSKPVGTFCRISHPSTCGLVFWTWREVALTHSVHLGFTLSLLTMPNLTQSIIKSVMSIHFTLRELCILSLGIVDNIWRYNHK